ncbi:DUF547 domain-containing protein [Nostoc sp. PCC 7120 = FACHB-418]|uniref:DUF547 domain-containing protein n=3 Tax=Nostocales TaxID=1161 RepID=A0A1Z4KGE2_ANAVA|nr:DUF547 domain-containing protein [Nostoc sp. PCC 7120 = FACHB-418]MBD2169883.1 DUF547 domain-containing protein [Anabaena cylindrica FACHB-318]MBD2261699.1 DUF547 domain-containing protein [Anabaena sp. FACHB-709]MBD2282447.1 DUF547 domain-containing protein [Anabaena cylindrica FACHB-170]MBD2348559.1 DUF547 domain-containing protein [Trichormus variabilis FACHB-171]BAY68029.1 hypothetical protein NIES23_08120 [Trichormus variabilis NIES-23]HBW29774.1 DUF547 domain-containing protein [Nost
MMDFQPWDELLCQYVDEHGRVDYLAWKTQQPHALANWLHNYKHLRLETNTSTSEQLALWINLYNALTISTILERYPIKSILPRFRGIPNWLAFLWFFQRKAYQIFGDRYSLAQIENQILRGKLQEPRIHFAIVCASVGCPVLRSGAYFPEQVMQQLDEDSDRFINNPEKVRYDFSTQTLYCSKIFKWYRQDFLKAAPSLPEYIGSYLKIDAPLTASTPIVYLDYDWSLNQRIS